MAETHDGPAQEYTPKSKPRFAAVPILNSAGVETDPPWLLGLFGEPGHALLIVHGYDDAQWRQAEARLARLFPEAEIRRDVEDPVFPGTRPTGDPSAIQR